MSVDADGFVWSNTVGLGQSRRYDPNGKLERILQLPLPRATDYTFGGPERKTLYITTARETMTPEQLAKAPLFGSVFAHGSAVAGTRTSLVRRVNGSSSRRYDEVGAVPAIAADPVNRAPFAGVSVWDCQPSLHQRRRNGSASKTRTIPPRSTKRICRLSVPNANRVLSFRAVPERARTLGMAS